MDPSVGKITTVPVSKKEVASPVCKIIVVSAAAKVALVVLEAGPVRPKKAPAVPVAGIVKEVESAKVRVTSAAAAAEFKVEAASAAVVPPKLPTPKP